jgi:acyl-coenzyme A synthetase/AMP-(fatty) acid ligase
LEAFSLPTEATVAVVGLKTVNTLATLLALGKQGHTPLVIAPSLGEDVKPTMYHTAKVYCELAAETDSVRLSVNRLPSETSADVAIPAANPDDASALMLTTSGSTGIPKVVRLSDRGINAFLDWSTDYFQLNRGRRVLSYAPLNFDLSLLEVWAPLAKGASVILAETNRATQPGYLRALVRHQKPDLIQAVPMFYTLLCPSQGSDGEKAGWVRHVVFTGDTTHQGIRERAAWMFPRATFHNLYGCTETNDTFVYSVDAPAIVLNEKLPLGKPIDQVAYRIVTEDGIELAGVGEGELHVSTPFMAHGYTDPEVTAQAFYLATDGHHVFYRTGDQVARNELGQLTLLGRKDFIVKVRGVRTNLHDIEQTLAKMDTVKHAVVIPVKDDVAGVLLHAVVEPTEGQKLDGIALRLFCARHLPQTAIPKAFFLHPAPLPTTSTGKPDRRAIAEVIQPKRRKSA